MFTDGSIRREALDLLSPTCDVRVLTQYPSEQELMAACADAEGILARLGTITGRVIEQAPRLRIIARHGVGVDAVDIKAATRRGIVVTTTGSENAAAVAEYTFALLLALMRNVVRADGDMRGGAWSRGPLIGAELDGRTLGIVGLGAIGRRVARQALGFGMRVLAADPHLTSSGDAADRAHHARRSSCARRCGDAAHAAQCRDRAPHRCASVRADEAGRVSREHRARRARGRSGA